MAASTGDDVQCWYDVLSRRGDVGAVSVVLHVLLPAWPSVLIDVLLECVGIDIVIKRYAQPLHLPPAPSTTVQTVDAKASASASPPQTQPALR